MAETWSHVAGMMADEPSAEFRELRSGCPVHHVTDHDPPFYAVGHFTDVVELLKQPVMWGNRHGPGVFHQDKGVLGTTDDPDHARHRAVLRSSFVPTSIAHMEPAVRSMADGLLDAMLPLGEGDFVPLFAFPLPALAIGELLGVRPEDRDFFGQLTHVVVAALTGGDVEAYGRARETLGDYVDARLADREAAGTVLGPHGDDVLSAMLRARQEGTLTRDEVRHLGHQLLVAGHETTTSLLAMMLHRLLERPAVLAELRAAPARIAAAVEEALRFDSPVTGLFRTNASACTLHGTDIPAGTKVQLVYGSANRDPEQFDSPDEFRIDRPTHEIGRHLAFGWGIHHCIGAPLARLVARVAFEQLLARTTHIELAGEPARNRSFVLHGLVSLPLRWTAV